MAEILVSPSRKPMSPNMREFSSPKPSSSIINKMFSTVKLQDSVVVSGQDHTVEEKNNKTVTLGRIMAVFITPERQAPANNGEENKSSQTKPKTNSFLKKAV